MDSVEVSPLVRLHIFLLVTIGICCKIRYCYVFILVHAVDEFLDAVDKIFVAGVIKEGLNFIPNHYKDPCYNL